MKLSQGSDSVWPGYVAAVASLLLSLLLLAGVLVVAISQIGRVVDSYNKQLITEIVEDERRAEEIGQLERRSQALNQARAQTARSVPAPVAPLPAAVPASAPERLQEQALDVQLQQKAAEMTAAQADWVRLDAQNRRQSLAAAAAAAGMGKVVRITFGAGAQGLEEQAIQELRTALSAQDLAGQRRWLVESGAKGLNAVTHREVFRLMLSLRAQLQEMGLPTERVRLVLDPERAPQDFGGSAQSGEVVILLRPDGAERGAS